MFIRFQEVLNHLALHVSFIALKAKQFQTIDSIMTSVLAPLRNAYAGAENGVS